MGDGVPGHGVLGEDARGDEGCVALGGEDADVESGFGAVGLDAGVCAAGDEAGGRGDAAAIDPVEAEAAVCGQG